MRTLVLFVAVAATTAYAQDLRAIVRVKAVDESARLARDLKRRGEIAELRGLTVYQPFALVTAGVVISADGEIVMPAVHPQAKLRIEVTFHDGSSQKADLLGTDPRSNLALLKVPVKPAHHLELSGREVEREQAVTLLGRDGDTAVQGDGVIVHTRFPAGIVDRFGRPVLRLDSICTVASPILRLQIGSACLDAEGRLLGITAGGIPAPAAKPGGVPVGTTFVVPALRIARVVRHLREHGRVVRAYYGAVIVPVSAVLKAHVPELPASACAVVRVLPDGPAAKGGLLPNDVILSIDGKTYPGGYHVGEVLTDKTPGEPVKLAIRRAGKVLDLTLTPAELE